MCRLHTKRKVTLVMAGKRNDRSARRGIYFMVYLQVLSAWKDPRYLESFIIRPIAIFFFTNLAKVWKIKASRISFGDSKPHY